MKLNKKHLSKLDMPAKKASPMESDQELEMELSDLAPEEESDQEDMGEEVDLDQLSAEPENEQLAAVPDEDLLAELKKRGLLNELMGQDGESDEPEEMEA